MKNISIVQIYFFFLTILISSCHDEGKILVPDVSGIDVDIRIERFDVELARIDTANILTWQNQMSQRYGAFYEDFTFFLLEVGEAKDSLRTADLFRQIAQKRDFKELAKAVERKYPNLKKTEEELTQSYKYLKYYIPEVEIPRFISFFAGFAVQIPIGEGYTGIGLDMFLGADSEFYPSLIESIPMYISRRFTPENIVPRIIETTFREEIFPQENSDVNALQHMIYNGKILYAMDLVMPYTADSLKIGYTTSQIEWANHYEQDIWAWFLNEDLLYNTDYLRIQKYFTDAPFTPELGERNESAPKLGSYLGWKIVKKYMKRNPEVSIKDLFANQDAQQILDEAKYKGK